MRATASAALIAAAVLASPAAAQSTAIEAMLDCRATAAAYLRIAARDDDPAPYDMAEALLAQTDLAMRLGFWGDGPDSVGSASQDMVLGERLIAENAARVERQVRALSSGRAPARALVECAPVIWRALVPVIDKLLAERAAD
jgi:hypothetical protein